MEHTAKTDAEINEPDGPNVALLRGNNTVCQHGSMSRKCDTCFAEAERDDHAITIKALTLALQESEARVKDLEDSVLVLLVKGLGFYEPPSHGHSPLYALCAWINLYKSGNDYTEEVRKMLDSDRTYDSDIVMRNADAIRERLAWYMKNEPTLAYKEALTKPHTQQEEKL